MAGTSTNEKKKQVQGVDTGSSKVAKSKKKKKKKVAMGISTSAGTRVLRPRSGQLKKTKTGDACEKTPPLVLAISKSDSCITSYLKMAP